MKDRYLHLDLDAGVLRPVDVVRPDLVPKASDGSAGSEAVDLDALRALLGHDDVEAEIRATVEATEFLAALRQRAGLSRPQLAARLDVAPQHLTEIEHRPGNRRISYDLIKRWGTACGVDVALTARPRDDRGRPLVTLVRHPGLAVHHITLSDAHGLCLTGGSGRDLTVIADGPVDVAHPTSLAALRDQPFQVVAAGAPIAVPRSEDDAVTVVQPRDPEFRHLVVVEVGPAVPAEGPAATRSDAL